MYAHADASVFRVMRDKEPKLQDFGITPKEYDLYIYHWGRGPSGWSIAISFLGTSLVFSSILFVMTRDVVMSIVGGFLVSLWPIPGIVVWLGIAEHLVQPAIKRHKRSRLLQSPVASQIKLYEEARAAYGAVQYKAEQTKRETERVRREAERVQQEAELARKRKLRDY